MNLGAALVQGGLLSRDVDAYNEQQASSGYRMRQIKAGIQRMDDEEASRPQRLQMEQLRRDIERAELEYKQRVQPTEQANADKQRTLAGGNLDTQIALQPGAAELARTTQSTQLDAAKAQQRMQPGQIQLAESQQQDQIRTAREQQLARLWGLYRTGDRSGFLDMLNGSSIVAPGRKFEDVKEVEGTLPTGEKVQGIVFVPGDGKPPIIIPVEQMAALEQKYNTKYEKVGNNLLRIGPNGITPVYEQDGYMAVPEGSTVASRRTGEIVRGGGGGASLPRRWAENFEKALPQREATDSTGQKKIDPKTGPPVMETDETMAPLIRDMVRTSSDVIARAKISPEEASARFAEFAKVAKATDPAKAYQELDQAGRLVVVTDKAGKPVKLLGRIGTAADGSPIVFELPTGIEDVLLGVEMENRFQREQEAGKVDEGPRLRRTHPNKGPVAVGKVRYPQAVAGINP